MAQQEKINEVHEEEQELHKEINASDDDGIKIINADTFHVHLQPDANGDNIIRSVLGRHFIKFRDILKRNQLKDFFRYSCFSHFLDLSIDPLPRFQMTIVYELLKRRFIFENPNKKDEIVINYCGM